MIEESTMDLNVCAGLDETKIISNLF